MKKRIQINESAELSFKASRIAKWKMTTQTNGGRLRRWGIGEACLEDNQAQEYE